MTIAPSALPFDSIRNLMKDLPGPDAAVVEKCRARDRNLTKPPGALGRLETIADG
jgi:nicotinate-nucleotide--dimethylbenzimidazole phosphoribosyltransferase